MAYSEFPRVGNSIASILYSPVRRFSLQPFQGSTF